MEKLKTFEDFDPFGFKKRADKKRSDREEEFKKDRDVRLDQYHKRVEQEAEAAGFESGEEWMKHLMKSGIIGQDELTDYITYGKF